MRRLLRGFLSVGKLPLPLAAGTAVSLRASRRQAKRSSATCCEQCGYDLTGNTSGRCSECGAAVETDRRVTA